MSRNANSTETPDYYRLTDIAAEIGSTVDAVAGQLGAANVFRSGGFRVTTAVRGRALLEEHHRRLAEAAGEAQRRAEEEQARHEAMRAAARAERDDTNPRVQQFGLATITITPDDGEGVLPVVAMTARAKTEFDGATMTRRPSRLDWQLGQAEGGAAIGPTWQQIKADAAARAAERAAKKAGAK